MKNLKALLVVSFLSCFFFFHGQTKKITFLVNGVCEMCENRIENALDINGISFASWDVKTKMCNVTFNTSKISEKKIHETLANVGHDTQLCKASNETYNNLHPCCQYVRKDSL